VNPRLETWLRTLLIVFAMGAGWQQLRNEIQANKVEARSQYLALKEQVDGLRDYAVLQYRVEQLEKRLGVRR